jgi:hypothetical protein
MREEATFVASSAALAADAVVARERVERRPASCARREVEAETDEDDDEDDDEGEDEARTTARDLLALDWPRDAATEGYGGTRE